MILNFVILMGVLLFLQSLLFCFHKVKRHFILRQETTQFLKILSKSSIKVKQEKSTLSHLTLRIDSYLFGLPGGKKLQEFIRKKSLPPDLNIGTLCLLTLLLLFVSANLAGFLDLSVMTVSLFCLFIECVAVALLVYFYQPKRALDEHLPTILEKMARMYRIEPDLYKTIARTSETISDEEVKKKFQQVVQISKGAIPTVDALEIFAHESKNAHFDFVVRAIKLYQPMGGNLAQLFEQTAFLVRRQEQTVRQVNATMFQNKVSAVIVSLLVPAVVLFATAFSPKYQEVLFYDPTARVIFVGAFLWWMVGVVFVFRMTRLRI